ncbi:unnamed protein product [Amaranthus hypochondriacus]
MGIQGLLPQLKSIMSPLHIKELEGCCVAVDTYSWLHKGALSCSTQLCKGLPTSRHIDYCMHRVNMLRHYGVKPILVFDGGDLPMKSEQENKRARSRKESLARAIEHESSGNTAGAYECYQKAVDISPAIAYELIQVLKQEGVCYIVAPYEADAQMTFLAITKQVDAVITEDSDLIAFGCPRIIYKMDKYGQGVEFQFHKLQYNKDLNFTGFTIDMIQEMCILSGCDYLSSLPGMGLKRAHSLISKFKTFQKVIKHLRYCCVAVPSLYEESFKKAKLTFRHQRVYDPIKEDIVNLTDVSDNNDGDLDFLGPLLPQQVVRAIAKGELDPISKLPFQSENAHESSPFLKSYKIKDFKGESTKVKLDLPAQKNVLTNYFCFASLEAKRNFRAPRISPKNSGSGNDSSPLMNQLSDADADAGIENDPSPDSLLGQVVQDEDMSLHNSMAVELSQNENADKDASVDGSLGQNPLGQSHHSIHKPCIILRRGHDDDHCSWPVPEKENQPDQHLNVKSPQLLNNSITESDTRKGSNKVTLRSSYFIDKQEDNYPRKTSKKAVVKSSYFNREPKTAGSDINSSCLVKEISCINNEISDKFLPELASVDNKYDKDLSMKRKASSRLNPIEHVNNKHPRTKAIVEEKSAEPSPSYYSCGDQPTEPEKFGCKISHLEHYSDISGKSMEKFVSVVSSFRFTSSGSRASGLRAPLRDVKNISSKRSTTATDLGKFSYTPNSAKVKRA